MSALLSVWTIGPDACVGHWSTWRRGTFDFEVRRDDRGRWSAVVTRYSPRLWRRSERHESQDAARQWCEETAWSIHGEEIAA